MEHSPHHCCPAPRPCVGRVGSSHSLAGRGRVHGSTPGPHAPAATAPRSGVEPGIELEAGSELYMLYSPVWRKGSATGVLAPLAPWGWGLTRLGSGAPSIPWGSGVGWGRGVGWAAGAEAEVAPGGVGWWGPSLRLRGLCFGVGARPARCSHWTAERRPGPRSGPEASGQWPCESFPVPLLCHCSLGEVG